MKKEHPELVNRLRTNAFEALSGIFYIEKPDDGLKYIQMIGLFKIKRTKRYIREDYIIDKAKTLNKWCVLLPKANGTGNFGEKLSAPILAGPGIAYTQTFIGIGATSSEKEAKKFEEEVTALDYVVACYSIGGDADFLLQVVSPDLDTYAEFSMSIIRRLPGIKEMQSMFVLKEIKPFIGFPVKPSQ